MLEYAWELIWKLIRWKDLAPLCRISALMLASSLECMDLRRCCEGERRFSGEWPLAALSRLVEAVDGSANLEGVVVYDVAFHRDGEGHLCLQGRVRATLALPCQRCLEPIPVKLGGLFHLAGVANLDEARKLPDSLEAVLLTEGTFSLPQLLEDELLLAMPYAPRHTGDCGVSQPLPADDPLAVVPVKANPFALLERLKGNE